MERILEAAYELFVLGGHANVSLRGIAKYLGVSPMMPYKYFPSKDHIMMTLRLRAFEQLTNRMELAFHSSEDAEHKLRAVCSAYLLFAQENENSYRLMFDLWEFDRQGEIDRDFGLIAKRETQSWLVNYRSVAEYVKVEGLQIDVNQGAHLVWSALHGLVTLHLSEKLVFGLSFEALQGPVIDSIIVTLRSFSNKQLTEQGV